MIIENVKNYYYFTETDLKWRHLHVMFIIIFK